MYKIYDASGIIEFHKNEWVVVNVVKPIDNIIYEIHFWIESGTIA